MLNINDNIAVTNSDFGIDEQEFNSYFLVLQNTGYIALKQGNAEFISTSYVVCNLDRFNKLINNPYKLIPKYIIPILPTILPLLIKA